MSVNAVQTTQSSQSKSQSISSAMLDQAKRGVIGAVAGAAIGSGSQTLIGKTLENITGAQSHTAKEIIEDTVLDATLGAISSKLFPVKVRGITTGRNSMSSVYKSGLTKLKNKTASRMSVKVMGKGVISNFVSDLGVSVTMGIKSYVIDTWKSYYYPQKPTYTGPVYWCAP